MKVFYHNDLDGQCAAFCVKLHKNLTNKQDFIEMDYKTDFPLESIKKDEEVWILDYSIDPSIMKKLLKKTENVWWIDHHRSAIEKYSDADLAVQGLVKEGISGCELTYMYLNGIDDREDVPRFIRYIGDYDVWDHKFKESSPFYFSLQSEDTHPTSDFWDKLSLSEINNTKLVDDKIKEGHLILKYRDAWAEQFVQRYGFETKFEGHNWFAANLGQCGSEYFKSVEKNHDLLISFAWDGKVWSVSLYSLKPDKVNVSEIAKKHGGGGHPGASGFTCKDLPFKAK